MRITEARGARRRGTHGGGSENGAVAARTTPSVHCEYSDGDTTGRGGLASYLRLTNVIYPNGRDVSYNYAQTVDNIMSRLAAITENNGTVVDAAYSYLGADTIATEDYRQPQIKLDYSANNFAALDRFGDVLDQVWSSYGSASGNLGPVDGYTYTYNQVGDRTSRANQTDSALSEIYGYDGLNRLTLMSRGVLSGGTIANPSNTQTWTLDSLGNFTNYNNNGSNQTRTVDAANEIETINGSSATSAYDLAGNMITTPEPGSASTALNCVYDAWDRLVQVGSGGAVMARYQYDGTGRQIEEFTNFVVMSGVSYPQAVTYYFYSGQNAIETRAGSATSSPTSLGVQYQYVFSPLGEKTPLVRDTYVSGQIVPNDRIYYLTDANTNVTAVVGFNQSANGGAGEWQVAERYVYDPYGNVTVCNPSWTAIGTSLAASTVGNTLGFASMSFDPVTGLYYDEARWYSTAVSTFISRDPAQADENLYRYCVSGLQHHQGFRRRRGILGCSLGQDR
ncbi:MAG: RHS repeat-associated core domain-containing protein [Thermoguttaceae bacterium]